MKKNMLRLGVNIDHVATLRQARGTQYPDPCEAARLCERAGAHGITVHLREDRRHIVDADIYALSKMLSLPMNLEMADAPDIMDIALEVRPAEVCLVPERREERTTEGGLDVVGRSKQLAPDIQKLRAAGIEVSLFIQADRAQLDASVALGAPTIELHTGAFADAEGDAARRELDRLMDAAEYAHGLGLKVNAGHGIHMENISGILRIPHLNTLNIGHSIVSRAVFIGLEAAVREMLEAMATYTESAQ